MPVWAWIVIAVVVVVAIAVVAWALTRSRSSELRDRFGPEYERTVDERGGRRAGESELRDRVKRREQLDVRPLPAAAAQRYVGQWRDVQARFVDAPGTALAEADTLITSVMRERGYPMDDFEQRSADLSVDHADVVDNYRAAHAISLANDHGQASTEDLRQAMVLYRSLFERMIETEPDRATTAHEMRS
jgi:hypothetical protein